MARKPAATSILTIIRLIEDVQKVAKGRQCPLLDELGISLQVRAWPQIQICLSQDILKAQQLTDQALAVGIFRQGLKDEVVRRVSIVVSLQLDFC